MSALAVCGWVMAVGLAVHGLAWIVAHAFFGPPDLEDDDGERWP